MLLKASRALEYSTSFRLWGQEETSRAPASLGRGEADGQAGSPGCLVGWVRPLSLNHSGPFVLCPGLTALPRYLRSPKTSERDLVWK